MARIICSLITNLQEQHMTSFTLNKPAESPKVSVPAVSLLALTVAFFTLSLREVLDPSYTGANEDAAYYACGL